MSPATSVELVAGILYNVVVNSEMNEYNLALGSSHLMLWSALCNRD
jgi:hypothetical protein